MKNTYAVPFIWLGPRTDVVFQSELELFNGWRSLQRPLSPQLTKSELNLVTKPNQSGSFVDSAGKVKQSSIRSPVNASIIYWFQFHWRLILFEKRWDMRLSSQTRMQRSVIRDWAGIYCSAPAFGSYIERGLAAPPRIHDAAESTF